MFKLYYQLTKPGIIYGNAITAIAGFLLASRNNVDPKLFIAMLVGLSLIIASACVFNNYYNRAMDAKMERTKNRALAKGSIATRSAIFFAIILLTLGVITLYFHTTNSALFAALLGFIVYVFIYTPLKRRTVYGTLIGAVAGATPPVVGYTAITNRLDAGAIILFLILVFWQMPHFYSIAIYRLKDYATAEVPVLPIKSGVHATKIQILIYIILFILAAASLSYFKFAGYTYLSVSMLLGLAWLGYAVRGFKVSDDTLWAKKMFRYSLVVITLLCVIIPIDILIKK